MLTSMRLHLIRMLTSMRLHSIRMLPHIRLRLICILSYICHNAACNSLCICFPKSLSLSLCNYHCLRICHSDYLTLINHTKHSGSSEWHLIDQSAVSTNYTDFQNRISFCSFAFNCYATPFVLIENVEVLSTVNSKRCCLFSFSFHCLVISVSLNSTPLSKLKCTSCVVIIIKIVFLLCRSSIKLSLLAIGFIRYGLSQSPENKEGSALSSGTCFLVLQESVEYYSWLVQLNLFQIFNFELRFGEFWMIVSWPD